MYESFEPHFRLITCVFIYLLPYSLFLLVDRQTCKAAILQVKRDFCKALPFFFANCFPTLLSAAK